MSNSYFDSGDYTALARNTRALAESVNAIATAVEAGFDLFPDKLSIQQSKATFVATDTGTPGAYVISLEKTPPAYSDGLHIAFRAANTNPGASTVNVSSLGIKDIRNYAGTALTGGEIVIGAFTVIRYDATNGYFRIISPLTTVGSISVNNNVKVTTNDTTPGPLNDKISVSGALSKSTTNPGANEVLALAVAPLALTDGGDKATAFNAAVNTKYTVDTSSTSYTVTLPSSATKGDIMAFFKYGTGVLTFGLNGLKYRGSTNNPATAAEGTSIWVYTSATRGWVEG